MRTKEVTKYARYDIASRHQAWGSVSNCQCHAKWVVLFSNAKKNKNTRIASEQCRPHAEKDHQDGSLRDTFLNLKE